MGIQSTREITRQAAEERIKEIYQLAIDKDYSGIDAATAEYDCSLREFVDRTVLPDVTNIEKWTDEMVEEVIDWPFFRWSLFENYCVTG